MVEECHFPSLITMAFHNNHSSLWPTILNVSRNDHWQKIKVRIDLGDSCPTWFWTRGPKVQKIYLLCCIKLPLGIALYFYHIIEILSKLYIKATRKCGLYEQLPFIWRLKLYALFINGKNETALYRQWFVIKRWPSWQVWLLVIAVIVSDILKT